MGQREEGASGFLDELVNVGFVSQALIHRQSEIFHRFLFCDDMISELDADRLDVPKHAFSSKHYKLRLCGVNLHRMKIEPLMNIVQCCLKCFCQLMNLTFFL